jgi:long-chain acyl-CoA synthetase
MTTDAETYRLKADKLSLSLLDLGIKPGDKIAVISSVNCTDWNIVDLAIQQVGAVSVPIYPTIAAKEFAYIFNHAEVRLCFLSDKELLDKVTSVREECPRLEQVYSFVPMAGVPCYMDLIEQAPVSSTMDELDQIGSSIGPDVLVTIIYTSGTTGTPKGVMLTHRNITENLMAAIKLLPDLKPGSRVLSFLPVCHIMERCAVYVYQLFGAEVYYGEGIDKIGDNIREVQPIFMTVVPRLLEKIYDKIYTRGSELKGFKKKLFYWSLSLGQHYELLGGNSLGYRIQLAIARKLIFRKWQQALGGQLEYLVCGSAALQPRLIRLFGAAGIRIIEGYGLTESPVLTGNSYRLRQVRPGTVGMPLDGIDIRIADDGEIVVRGNNVMAGYYKDPELTAEVLKNGTLHTGDKGAIDADGFLRITGRKKEIFKTSGGKYIAPVLLENRLKQSRFIEQVMVIGENEKMPAALIQPDFDFLRAWAARKGHEVPCDNPGLIEHKKIRKRIRKEVEKANKKFGQWEKIKAFKLTPEVWTTANGLLTPTLKMKRNSIVEKYRNLYQAIYATN